MDLVIIRGFVLAMEAWASRALITSHRELKIYGIGLRNGKDDRIRNQDKEED